MGAIIFSEALVGFYNHMNTTLIYFRNKFCFVFLIFFSQLLLFPNATPGTSRALQ